MTPYITLNGVSSLDKGLRLIAAETFVIPKRTRQRENVPGRLGSIASDVFEYPTRAIKLRLGGTNTDKAAVSQDLHAVADWLLSARMLTIWHSPEHYYLGAVEDDTGFSMLTRTTGQIEVDFLCDPPCRHKAKVTGGFIPALNQPIPEQLSNTNMTAKAAAQTAAFSLSAGTVAGSLPPALYLKITGTWTSLTIGGSLSITEAAATSTTIFIDCDAQEVYQLVAGARTPVRFSGAFPALASGSLGVDGVGFSVDAHILVIERG